MIDERGAVGVVMREVMLGVGVGMVRQWLSVGFRC